MSVVSQTHISEGKARRLDKNGSLKCNFKYLMNSKTNRSTRNIKKEKQNEIESVLMSKAHKYALKTERVKTCYNDSQRVICSFKQITPFGVGYGDNQEDPKNDKTKRSNHTLGNQTDLEELKEVGCMTEECYSVKELQIKMELLKKERDDMWNSIADIVRQNQDLKQTMKRIELAKNNKNCFEVQTQIVRDEYAIQTQVQWETMSTELTNTNKQIIEAKEFCQHFLSKQETGSTIKNYISEAIRQSIQNLTKQFQTEKAKFQQMHHSQIAKQNKVIDAYKQKADKMEGQLKQQLKIKANMENIYAKEIQQIRSLLVAKEAELTQKVIKMEEQLQKTIKQNEQQNGTLSQYIESLNRSWLQKQKIYSTLLSESHKTINSLMLQMRQFESLANSNYTKYLQSSRMQINRD